jgi:hypothetical protein
VNLTAPSILVDVGTTVERLLLECRETYADKHRRRNILDIHVGKRRSNAFHLNMYSNEIVYTDGGTPREGHCIL